MRTIRFLLIGSLFLAAQSTAARAQEYDATNVWLTLEGKARPGNASIGFALPVLHGEQTIAVIGLVCPRKSDRGPFLAIPFSLLPMAEVQGKEFRRIIVINGQAFAGYFERTRVLVYFNDAQLSVGVPGIPMGKSVREALAENLTTLRIRTDPAGQGIAVRFNRATQDGGELFGRLRSQGYTETSLPRALALCEDFSAGRAVH